VTEIDCHNNQLTSLDVSGLTTLESLDCYNNQLTSVIGEGFDGSYYAYGSMGAEGANFKNNLLTTDAIYALLDMMVIADPATFLEVDGNPCEVDNVLQDGILHTAAETSALAAARLITLVLN